MQWWLNPFSSGSFFLDFLLPSFLTFHPFLSIFSSLCLIVFRLYHVSVSLRQMGRPAAPDVSIKMTLQTIKTWIVRQPIHNHLACTCLVERCVHIARVQLRLGGDCPELTPSSPKHTHTHTHTHTPHRLPEGHPLRRMPVWSEDLCCKLLEAWFTVMCLSACGFFTQPCESMCAGIFMNISGGLHFLWSQRSVKIYVLTCVFMQTSVSSASPLVCVCVWVCMEIKRHWLCLLVMDTNGPGQASMKQGGRFVCLTPSCCPHPGRGGPEGWEALWGSGSPSACITLNINTHCSLCVRQQRHTGSHHTHGKVRKSSETIREEQQWDIWSK